MATKKQRKVKALKRKIHAKDSHVDRQWLYYNPVVDAVETITKVFFKDGAWQ